MEIYNVLKKVEQKLANSNEYDLAKQKLDSEMGDLALTCIKNKRAMSISNNSKRHKNANIDLSSIKDKIVNSASSLKNTLENTPGAKTLGYGLAGTGIGSLLGSYLTSDKSEDETDEQYKSRKMESAVTGGIAGTALGVSAPSVLNSIKSFINLRNEPESGVSKITDSIKGSIINPTTATVAAGATGGGILNRILSKLDEGQIAVLTGKLEGSAAKDAPFIEAINTLKGKSPLIGQVQVPPIEIPFRPTIAQKLVRPKIVQKLLPYLNKVLAHSSRGKMLLAGGAAAGLLGKNMLDTSAFNESVFE